jgi:hypothetical protein
MPSLFKNAALSIALLAGAVAVAQAQTVSSDPASGQSIANLPPEDSDALPNVSQRDAQMPIVQTGTYPGPAPGAGTGQMPPRFEKPADWDQNVALHPYTSPGMGPKPH